MLSTLILCGILFNTPEAESLIGKIQVSGSSIRRVVSIVVNEKPVHLTGKMVRELSRLSSIKVEVLGNYKEQDFTVEQYRIIDIGGGIKPLVGTLAEIGEGLGLKDGSGTPILLNMPPRSKARMAKKVGAKIWVHGRKLVSGELKILRYGILLNPSEIPSVQKTAPKDEVNKSKEQLITDEKSE